MRNRSTIFAAFFLLLFSAGECFAADVYLYVARHGKTLFNTVHRAQGWSDTPLTSEGVDVARKLGEGLKSVKFATAWSSDSGRARETAYWVMKPNYKPVPLKEQRDLREVFFGHFEGDTNENMQTAAAIQAGYSSSAELLASFASGKMNIVQVIDMIKAADKSGQAESYQQVAQRMKKAVTAIAREAQQKGGGNVLIVSHGMAIMSLLHELGDRSVVSQLENASVTKIRYTDAGEFVIESIGDMRFVERGAKQASGN
ncbi:histidine phosphatase family protein [Pantoea sp. CCBC3-3-1]|uniref:histidine phosphatase family protein n=1 Tax=Pantoea sp. CCBC3-3-1 TaxID=2490851 RepID=UPI0011BF5152|nr:histidine phosphatase family protein [Pantoea sp. CCBC3-3-1]